MRTWIFGVATFVVAAFLTLVGAEAIARTALAVRQIRPPLDDGLPVLQEPDEVLGWRNKAGSVVWPGRGEDGGKDIRMTFWADGLRATAPAPELDRPHVVVIGCSYTQGWAVTDEETYPWRLQAEFPSHAFLNYGTAGYGTYQSLLALERYFAAASRFASRRHLRIHRLPRGTQRGAGRVVESAGDRLTRRDALGPVRVDRR